MNTLMIYGASGYTGRMATEYAKSAGLNVVAAGCDVNKVTRLATELGVHVSGTAFPEGDLLALPEGPDATERASNRYQAARRVLEGTTRSGFQTPAGLFGHQFATKNAIVTVVMRKYSL